MPHKIFPLSTSAKVFPVLKKQFSLADSCMAKAYPTQTVSALM